MSTPINHHYVSQCQIRNFFNGQDKLIYCYDKQLDNYFSKSTTKSLFSEEFSNTRVGTNDELDHETLENELNLYFEQDFEKHSRNVVELANNPHNNDDTKLESLYYLVLYALIADIRIPENKKNIDESYATLMRETAMKVRMLGDEKQADEIEKSLINDKTKYSNVVHYTEIAASRLAKMGDLDFKCMQ
ncbi:MAG: DUF4238 domain-containing protein [Chitinophagaceae bacterium]|nr:DUF4238 domain-containing protein [Chitinophagaceae bacterium]